MSHRRKEEERKPRPWESDREGGAADSFGGWLKRQRGVRDISLREISDVTKINLRYLEALEDNRLKALPAPVFARGFLREYARYVGLDPDEVVNYYTAAQQEQEPEGASSGPRPDPSRATTQWVYGLVLTAGVVALFGAVAGLSYWASNRPRAEQPPPIAAPVFEPAPPAPVMPAAPAQAPLEVTLDFTENCWVEAVIDGSERISELRVQGESLRLTANQSVSLSLANAAGVRIEVNGRPFETAGADAVRDLEITLESLQAGEQDAPAAMIDPGTGGAAL
jgi:cytoskeletal protein RodZ